MSKAMHHWCCKHSAADIAASGLIVKPRFFVWAGLPLSWWTDDCADREGLGLTMRLTKCDRMEARFRVADEDAAALVPWLMHPARALVPGDAIIGLEGGSALPHRWWVSTRDVRVVPAPLAV